MPRVTKISQGENKETCILQIEGEQSLTLHMELVLLHNIKEGSSIQTEELKGIILEDQRKRAFNRSLHYLTHKRRTRWEVEDYLRRKGFTQIAINHTIDKLTYYGMLDDEAYMKAFISDKKLGNPIGRKKLLYDLSRKGIQEEMLVQLDRWFTREDEEEQARKLAVKASKKYSQLPLRERMNKINQAGQRRGFSWEIMKRVIQDVLKDTMEEQDVDRPSELDKEKALEWGIKYRERYQKKGLQGNILKQKIIQGLKSRGYHWETIEEVLGDIMERDR